jgi:hypothetical protein
LRVTVATNSKSPPLLQFNPDDSCFQENALKLLECIDALLISGADPTLTNGQGEITPLMWAVGDETPVWSVTFKSAT